MLKFVFLSSQTVKSLNITEDHIYAENKYWRWKGLQPPHVNNASGEIAILWWQTTTQGEDLRFSLLLWWRVHNVHVVIIFDRPRMSDEWWNLRNAIRWLDGMDYATQTSWSSFMHHRTSACILEFTIPLVSLSVKLARGYRRTQGERHIIIHSGFSFDIFDMEWSSCAI